LVGRFAIAAAKKGRKLASMPIAPAIVALMVDRCRGAARARVAHHAAQLALAEQLPSGG
jgi:hypothetical protein